MPIGLPPVFRPEELSGTVPHRQTQVAGSCHPIPSARSREVVVSVIQAGGGTPGSHALGQTIQREPPAQGAVSPDKVQVVAFGGVQIVALHRGVLAESERGIGEEISDALSPPDGARCRVDAVQVVVQVHHAQEGGRTILGYHQVTDVGAKTCLGGNQALPALRPGSACRDLIHRIGNAHWRIGDNDRPLDRPHRNPQAGLLTSDQVRHFECDAARRGHPRDLEPRQPEQRAPRECECFVEHISGGREQPDPDRQAGLYRFSIWALDSDRPLQETAC